MLSNRNSARTAKHFVMPLGARARGTLPEFVIEAVQINNIYSNTRHDVDRAVASSSRMRDADTLISRLLVRTAVKDLLEMLSSSSVTSPSVTSR